MRSIPFLVFLSVLFTAVAGQPTTRTDSIRTNKLGDWNKKPGFQDFKLAPPEWYSETTHEGVIIQNSFPKGGPLNSLDRKRFKHSHLVFFTRITNETSSPLQLTISFSADSFPIPAAPDTFMKLFLPTDTMTLAKQILYSYGVTGLESILDSPPPNILQRTINPAEDFLFYVVGIFYKTSDTARDDDRGGNRAELVLKGQELFYRMPPQLDFLPCGRIIFGK